MVDKSTLNIFSPSLVFLITFIFFERAHYFSKGILMPLILVLIDAKNGLKFSYFLKRLIPFQLDHP